MEVASGDGVDAGVYGEGVSRGVLMRNLASVSSKDSSVRSWPANGSSSKGMRLRSRSASNSASRVMTVESACVECGERRGPRERVGVGGGRSENDSSGV